MLSDADSAALAFATFLRSIALRYRNGSGQWGTDEAVTVSGDAFQRWLLKLLVTHAAADVFTANNGTPVQTVIAPEAIDLLLNRAQWPETWGMGVTGDLTNSHLAVDPFTKFETVTTNWWAATPFIKHEPRIMLGGVVELAGVSFTLCVFNQSEALTHSDPINPLRGAVQRPSSLAWTLNGVAKTINFVWSDPWRHVPLTITMTPRARRR